MFTFIIFYLAVGFIWAGFLENFTTKNLEGEFGRPWTWSERSFHFLLVPISFLIFAYHFLQGFFDQNNEQ